MNDKRFIEANELKYIESDANAYSEEWNADYEKGFRDCLDKVMALPTIEAQPVKRGSIERLTNAERYETFYKSRIDFDGRCSECGSFVFDTDKLCPECGAVFHNEEDGDSDA